VFVFLKSTSGEVNSVPPNKSSYQVAKPEVWAREERNSAE